MFPDLVLIRRTAKAFAFDILEPHDPSRADNVPKARGLAQFAEKHGHLFGQIELIRKAQSGSESSFVRLDFNDLTIRREALLANDAAQLDALFLKRARTR